MNIDNNKYKNKSFPSQRLVRERTEFLCTSQEESNARLQNLEVDAKDLSRIL
jgi:hypothetical protein